MAIVIESEPPKKQPAWNDMNIVTSSGNTAQPGFKVVAKVYIDATLVQTLNLFTVPGTTRQYINIARIIQNYITDVYQGIQTSPAVFGYQDIEFCSVVFQEYYSGALQGVTKSSGNCYFWRSAFPPYYETNDDWYDWMLDYNLATDNGTLKMLTAFDNVIQATGTTPPATISTSNNFVKLREGQRFFLRSMMDDDFQPMDWTLGIYDSTGTRTHSDTYALALFWHDRLYSFAMGIDEIESHSWTTGFTLDSDDKYLAIQINSGTGGYAQTYTYLFELVWSPCNAYEEFEVHWLNQYGGFDSWVFDRNSKHDTIINQATHKLNPFDVSSPTYDAASRFVRPHHTQLQEVYDLNTNNLKEWEYNGLKSIITSPEIYIKINDVYFSAYVQDVNQYRNYKAENGIFNMNLKLEIDNSEQRQW